MRTADLINLLRSNERTKASTRDVITTLDPSRRLHLLGELSNWLLVEMSKYRDRQAGGLTTLETPQQGSIRSQIRHTLLAIQVLLDSYSAASGHSESKDSKRSSGSTTNKSTNNVIACNATNVNSSAGATKDTPSDRHTSSSNPASKKIPMVALDDSGKEKILDSFLRPLLIGIVPLGGLRSDTSDIQLLCAKILCFCTNPLNKDSAPFLPETLSKRMMTLPAIVTTAAAALDRDRSRAPPQADAVIGMSALLRSPMIKLQDYGLRIMTSHRILVQLDRTWDLLGSVRSILEALKDDLVKISGDQPFELNGEDPELEGSNTHVRPTKDIETAIGVRSRALTFLQWTLQEAGKRNPATHSSSLSSPSLAQGSTGTRTRLLKLEQAVSLKLLIDLWEALQHIVLFDRTEFLSESTCERLVLLVTASVYWLCWLSPEEAVAYVMTEGADTLMAWYGYFIIPRDRPTEAVSPSVTTVPVSTSGHGPTLEPKDGCKHQGATLEYLAKLIHIMVMSKKHHLTLFTGSPPVGIVIMRRTIEFLEGVLESALPLMGDSIDTQVGFGLDLDASSAGDPAIATPKTISYAVRTIQERPGILEAMLGILVGCFDGSHEGESLVLNSQLLNVLILLLSNIQDLFSIQHLADSSARRILLLSLSLLQSILKRDVFVSAVLDVPMSHWTLAYEALAEMIMRPLEQELDVAASASDQSSRRAIKDKTSEDEIGLKALRLFGQFWQHHLKGRNLLSDLLGPRLHLLSMVPILVYPFDNQPRQVPDSVGTKAAIWRKERTLLLMDIIVYFACESSVRIKMRERWSSSTFLVALLGASMKRLESSRYSSRDRLSRAVAKRCFMAFRFFWYDRTGLVQFIELDLSQTGDERLWEDLMPSAVASDFRHWDVPSTSAASVVPILLAILAPPGTEWSSELMLGSSHRTQSGCKRRNRPRNPLFDRNDSLLEEAAAMLAQLCQFQECQQRLISKPGAIWMLSRMMVERSLVGNLTPDSSSGNCASEDPVDGAATEDNGPREKLEKAIFEALTRVLSAIDLAKSLVSNNTMTELFAAILEIDRSLTFYDTKMFFEDPLSNAHETEAVDPSSDTLILADQILPISRQQGLHQQLLQHIQTVMQPLRGQFERIYQYVGGHRSLHEPDETSESVYWLREYCALVFLYTMAPPTATAGTSNISSWWGSRIDKTALLNSETVFGIVCRMLTLEMEYDNEEEREEEREQGQAQMRTGDQGQNGANNQKRGKENVVSAQTEEAILRRFSAGLAIQSLCWKHAEEWRRQHFGLMRSYMTVMTTEWETHAAAMKGTLASAQFSTNFNGNIETPLSVNFLVQGRTISFPDRFMLSRTSTYFHTLLLGSFAEASLDHIVLQDVDSDDFQMLIEVLQESRMTAQLLLPEDLPFELVLRLMVCAERFMVKFVKRLAERWIMYALGDKETRCYEKVKILVHSSGDRKRDHEASPEREQQKRLKPGDDCGSNTSDDNELTATIEMQSNEQVSREPTPSDEDIISDDDEDQEEPIHAWLLMVYEACSDPHHGDIYSSAHPFYELVWDVLKRMALRLGSVATIPQFSRMLEQGGEERIQELLQILYELIVNNIPTATAAV